MMRSIQDPSAAGLGKKPDTQNETSITIASTRGRKPRRTARGPKPPALADSATAIITEISGVIDADDPTKKPSAEQTATPTSNAEISAILSPENKRDTARFYQHVGECLECEQGNGRAGRLCSAGTLLARPRDMRIRAKAPKLRALGPAAPPKLDELLDLPTAPCVSVGTGRPALAPGSDRYPQRAAADTGSRKGS